MNQLHNPAISSYYSAILGFFGIKCTRLVLACIYLFLKFKLS